MASEREKRAAELGMSLAEYKNTNEYKASKKQKDYYKHKEKSVKKRAKVDIKRLGEDFQNVLRMAGIEINRTTDDWVRNMANLAEDRAADTDDMNYYVQTQQGRTQEDLDTSLYKEARRYELETARNAESLASRNLVYSGLPTQQGGIAGYEKRELGIQNTDIRKDINTQAQRSFEDIARYEFQKSRDITSKYNRAEFESTLSKDRGIEDIGFGVDRARLSKDRGVWDINFNKKNDLYENTAQKNTSLSGLYNETNDFNLDKSYGRELWNAKG